MSVKASWFQIGLSGTANLNFHWRNLLDGVLRLTRGNAGAPITDVMLVNADNSVAFPSGVSGGVLGAGQPLQNVTGSRALSTVYTNSTGKPIFVNVQMVINTANCNAVLATQGINYIGSSTGNAGHGSAVCGIVAAGASYSATSNAGTPTLVQWNEMR